jgi:DNA-binding CsgD family transcriptional regulator
VIAARLHVSEHTLRNHLTSIYSKLGLPNRLALYAYAHRHGLTEPG